MGSGRSRSRAARNSLTTSSVRSPAPSRVNIRLRCVRTVEQLMPMREAISLSCRPYKSCSAIWACRVGSRKAATTHRHTSPSSGKVLAGMTSPGVGDERREDMAGSPNKKSVEPRTLRKPPPRGMKNVPMADAPCGARLKALPLQIKLGGFSGSSSLMLAHQFSCWPPPE